jgi:hypothetical protein
MEAFIFLIERFSNFQEEMCYSENILAGCASNFPIFSVRLFVTRLVKRNGKLPPFILKNLHPNQTTIATLTES